MGALPFGTFATTMIRTNLFRVVPRQLTKSVPTLKVKLIHDSKKYVIARGQFDLKKDVSCIFVNWVGKTLLNMYMSPEILQFRQLCN
jgi:hypothetical protein